MNESPKRSSLSGLFRRKDKEPAAARRGSSRHSSNSVDFRPPSSEQGKHQFVSAGSGRVGEESARLGAARAVRNASGSERIKLASATLEVSVLEARSLPVLEEGCFFRIYVEGAAHDTDILKGPDPKWALPTEEGEDPHPLNNFTSMSVVDVTQANVHVMLMSAQEELIAVGLVPVNRFTRFGRSVHEVTRWMALQRPNDVYFPTAEALVAMAHHTYPPPKKKKNNVVAVDSGNAIPAVHEHSKEDELVPEMPPIAGYVSLRFHLRVKNGSTFGSILRQPPVPDELPDEVQHQLSLLEPDEPVFELVARGKLLFAFLFAFGQSWRGLMLAIIPFWYHLVFWAPLWEYPLLVFVFPTLALTVRQLIRRPKHIEMSEAGIVAASSRVKASELGVITEPMRQFFRFVSGLLGGALVPTGEKIQNSFAFVVQELSLIFVFGSVLAGFLISLLVLLFDDPTVVFMLGLLFFIPRTVHVIATALWGQEVNVYRVGIIKGQNLEAFDAGGTSDPYCRIRDLECIASRSKVKTSIQKKTLNPTWNSSFQLALDDMFHHGLAGLEIELWDSDVAAKDDFMGSIVIRRRDFRFEKVRTFPILNTKNVVHGSIEISLEFLGQTYEKFKTSTNPYWRQWPMVKRLLSFIPTVGLSNVMAKLPDYVEGARMRYSDWYFFVDVANVVPKAGKSRRIH